MNIFRSILARRDFWPVFGAMSLGAFNDNFMRQALTAFLAYGAVGLSAESRGVMGSLAVVLMILPFFLFSSLCGQLADKHLKSDVLKVSKLLELAVMIPAALMFFLDQVYGLFALLFLMGAQSTLFGPVKYGILPEILPEERLLPGNALFGGATFLAIALGTAAGSYLVTTAMGPGLIMPLGLVAVAGLGFLFAFLQPASSQRDREVKVERKIWLSTWEILKYARSSQDVWLTILAISWFWGMGSILLAQVPIHAAGALRAAPEINTLLVTSMAVGVALGSLLAQRLTRGRVSASLVPATSLILAAVMLALGLAVSHAWAPAGAGDGTVGIGRFFQTPGLVLTAGLCFLASLAGGVFVVPLNAMLQRLAPPGQRARLVAANNIMNSLFMVAGNLVAVVFLSLGLGLGAVFFLVALTALVVSLMTLIFVPRHVFSQVARLVIWILYRPRIRGLENLETVMEGPALVVANHLSFADVAFLVAYIPRELTFAIDFYQSRNWWVKALLHFYKAVPINPALPMGTRELINCVERGEMLVIFPEGHLNSTGALMKVYEGAGFVASHCGCPVVTVILTDLEYTRFGRLRKLMANRPVRLKVGMTVFPPTTIERPAPAPRARGEKAGHGDPLRREQRKPRQVAAGRIFDLLSEAKFQSRDVDKSIWRAMTDAARRYGRKRPVLEDASRKVMTYAGLVRSAKVLGRYFLGLPDLGDRVGMLLPNCLPMAATIFGLWAAGKTPVVLNFSQGPRGIRQAMDKASPAAVVTSRRFLAEGGLEHLLAGLPAKIIYLEDLNLGLLDKIRGLLWRPAPASPEKPAVVLFTSGSEGQSKGVVLSHRNIVANIWQGSTLCEIVESDVFFNAMPCFHAFGLVTGLVLPLILGVSCYLHPSPLQVKAIPELIYDTRATVIIGTDNFASAWGRAAHPFDFHRVKIFVIGAEKMRRSTYELFFHKMGLRLFEGYGVTEGAPILAVNSLLNNRFGSAGRVIPGLKYKIEPVPGLGGPAGRFMVRGPNLMIGYLNSELPGGVQVLGDEWYDTGDIAEVDQEGYLWIRGRYKRFAKLSGEMVSLAAIEEIAASLWPEAPPSVISMVDPNRGERLVLVHEGERPESDKLRRALLEAGLTDLYWPKLSLRVEKIPMTPLGKVNVPLMTKMCEDHVASEAAAGRDFFGGRQASSGGDE
ncbi:MAG: MFS transporter [Deltaproteobacteria bacterium]|jgi:acyl-[acyl-carrier-protein]-phospholipid O-acyltransferase/long-chain-fatty-acid--[acyl-carrier-protein] ligase|nr:MFS transporter [Deltaproteobacteria bacterium]